MSSDCHYGSPRIYIPFSMSMACRNVLDGYRSTREPTLKEEQDKYAGYHHLMSLPRVNVDLDARCEWRAPLQCNSFYTLKDWATALRARHAMGIVHGNLTPESVGVVHGRGILIGQRWSPNRALSWTREAGDDVYGARWTATEFFRLDNGNPRPTKMSDVYSFACLMLQMLTGCVPYCGTKRSEQVVYLKYLGREPIDAQTPEVEDRYVAFMRWCWSPEPEKRPTMETIVSFIQEEIKRLGG